MTAFAMRTLGSAALIVLLAAMPAMAQDIRGMEACMAEKQMERRTGCLQANAEFLHQALIKQAREHNEKLNATARELAAARAEIAALKERLAKLESEFAQLKTKIEPKKP
jgi:hypothetical protein